jgi:predicted AAA+ superfamily ATPase
MIRDVYTTTFINMSDIYITMDPNKVTWLRQAFSSMNPWWHGGADALDVARLVPREALADLLASVRGELVTSLIGPRQVGKTTLLRQCIRALIEDDGVDPRHILMIDLDTPYIVAGLERPLNDLLEVYSTSVLGRDVSEGPERVYVFLDEVCGLPDWERVLKGWQDMHRPVKFVASYSSMTAMARGHGRSLTGRVAIERLGHATLADWVRLGGGGQELPGLAHLRAGLVRGLGTGDAAATVEVLREAHSALYPWKVRIIASLEDYLVWGGYPGLVPLGPREREARMKDIVDLTMLRDVAGANDVREVTLLRDFTSLLCRQTAGILNLTNIASELGRDRWILSRFLDHLVEAGVVQLSHQYTGPFRASARKDRKVHVAAPGFANEMAAALHPRAVFDTGRASLLAESVASAHLTSLERGHLGPWGKAPRFWRERGAEVDVIVEPEGTTVPIEVKYGLGRRGRSAIRAFMDRWEAPIGIVAHMGELKLEPPVLEVPLWLLLMLC